MLLSIICLLALGLRATMSLVCLTGEIRLKCLQVQAQHPFVTSSPLLLLLLLILVSTFSR